MNPLKNLYQELSEGIHAVSDADSPERALAIRRTFDFVFENLREKVEEAKRYKAEINKLGKGRAESSSSRRGGGRRHALRDVRAHFRAHPHLAKGTAPRRELNRQFGKLELVEWHPVVEVDDENRTRRLGVDLCELLVDRH